MSFLMKAHEKVYLSEQKRQCETAECSQAVRMGADALQSTNNEALQAPTSNTGRLEGTEISNMARASESYEHYISVGGKVVPVALRRGVNTSAHIDTLTLSMSEDVFKEDGQEYDSMMFASAVSAYLVDIFGFGVSIALNGRNGYRYSFALGGDKSNYGFIAFGGSQQRNTICIHLTGVGCVAALDGWEHRLYDFIQDYAPYSKITRIDIAHDFMNGEYTPDQCFADWSNGLFKNGRTNPKVERVGTDWDNHDNSGKTCYVGKGSRQFYAYEKGKQLGDQLSSWVRGELRLKNKDLHIPHEAIINAGEYLAGSFPALSSVLESHDAPRKVELKEKEKEISIEHVLFHAKNQASRAIAMLNHLGFDDAEIVEALWKKDCGLPKRVSPDKYDCKHVNVQYLHEFKRVSTDSQLANYQNFGISHRSYDEYIQLQRLNRLKKAFPTKEEIKQNINSGKYTYDDVLLHKYLTPHSILNPNFK